MLISIVVFWKNENIEDVLRCLKSIDSQLSHELEVLLVDNSGEGRKEMLTDFFSNEKYKYMHLEEVKETLEMIKIGISKVAGQYIQIMDACDYLPIDWLYHIQKYLKDTDLIIGNQYYLNGSTIFEYNFSITQYLEEGIINKSDLANIFILNGGEDRSVVGLNNKICRKAYLEKMVQTLIHTKVKGVYSLYLLTYACIANANKIVNMKSVYYMYNMKKEVDYYLLNYKSILADFIIFIKQLKVHFYKNINCISQYKLHEKEWDKYKVDWYKELYNRLCIYQWSEKEKIHAELCNSIRINIEVQGDTSFFESTHTELESSFYYYEKIKRAIADPQSKYIGFDIFDTLVQRPFWEPTDLFYLLNNKFNELVGKKTAIDFALIRKEGESACRGYYMNIRPMNEDVSLQEIYDYISENYSIQKEITDTLLEYEIELELKYCSTRKIGKELFEFAKGCGKKIIIASDMYLPLVIIEKILKINGYNGYTKLYLSNEVGISKYSGALFRYILQDLKINEPKYVCFIGDNYGVDFIRSQENGMIPFHVPKATDLFMGVNNAIYTGDFFKKIYQPNGGIIDQGSAMKFLGIRCMMAVAANYMFGNPFVSFNKESDFNANPEIIGYYCVGSFLYSEAIWLHQQSIKNKVPVIHFVARDGYWIKEAYDILHKVIKEGADSDYMYFSRKAVAPLYLRNEEGIFELFLPPHIMSQTPESIVRLLKVVVKSGIDWKKELKIAGIAAEKKFTSLHQYYIFSRVFIEKLYDKELAMEYEHLLKQYFSEIIHEGDAICDVGYSGRMETALTKLLGFPVNSFYFHEHEPWALMRKRKLGFNIDSFYSFKPCSAFVLREQILTPSQPSCIGFEADKGIIKPIFSDYNPEFKEKFVLDIIQHGAIKFIRDMTDIFGQDILQLDFNRFDACIPLEFYLHYAKDFDRNIFSAIRFEDEFGTNKILSLKEYWTKESELYGLQKKELKESILELKEQDMIQKECKTVNVQPPIYTDGIYIKLFEKLNKIFPIGSKRRTCIKRVVRIFVR